MERLTKTSNKGGLAFTFDLDITCERSEIEKILKLGEKLKAYEDAEEQGLLIKLPPDGQIYHIEESEETSERWIGNKPIVNNDCIKKELKKIKEFIGE
jgi:hypothetical protein